MANPAPVEGRCNAQTRGERADQYCANPPVNGSHRCRMHGGTNPGRPIIHGRYSQRFRRLSDEMVEAIHANMQDPNLLDMRRQVAFLQAMLFIHGGMPNDDTLRELATTSEMERAGIEPSVAQVERMRSQFLRRAADLSTDVLKAQQMAMREQGVSKALEQAVPALIGRLFERLSAVVTSALPPDQVDAVVEKMKNEARIVLVETMQLAQDARK